MDDELRPGERHSRFASLGRATYRHRVPVVAIWLLAFLISTPILLRVEEPLKVGGFSSNKTEAARARAVIEEDLGGSASQLIITFHSDLGGIDSEQRREQIDDVLGRFVGRPHVVDIISPADNSAQISRDGQTAYAIVSLDLSSEQAQRLMPDFRDLVPDEEGIEILLAGGPAFYADIETVSQNDLQRAEMIAFPFALIALLFVFGTVVAALLPLIVGGLGVAAVLTAIFAIAHVTDLSIFVMNLSTMLGLGLAIDYSLFITSRFREELPRSSSIAEAIERTMATAGRAIFFSGLTVLIGLSGLMTFDFMFLRSEGVAGVIVVFFSVSAALTLLPALLAIVGPNIERWPVLRRSPERRDGAGFWATLSRWVMRRPVLVLVPTALVLVTLGAPFRHVNISSPDATILPRSTESRQGFDLLVESFGPGEISPILIVTRSPTSMFSDDNILALRRLIQTVQANPEVSRVEGFAAFDESITNQQAIALVRLQRQLGSNTRFDQFANETTGLVLVYSRSYPNSDASKALLDEIRGAEPGGDFEVLVDGGTAEIVDVVDEMYGIFPRAIALVLFATYVVLFLLFQSVFLPLKAIVMNTLSLLASYGALVWVFQDGHLERVLRFESLGYVEASLPIIMFCILFGLSMDYEVFLLSRVREEWERSGDNAESVAIGLQRSGRIISSAAIIVVVVAISFVSADVILVKALGFGIALAVFLDATIVRALLVPATMRLMGHWNWWRPRFLSGPSLRDLRE
jgi:RND superfamily putative drug exporter